MLNKIIGGEFEINPNEGANQEIDLFKEGVFFASGRSALYNILIDVDKNRPEIKSVYLPDYLCNSIIDTVKKTRFTIKFYPLSDLLVIDTQKFSDVYSECGLVFIINYFGMIDLSDSISFLHSIDENICIIEDDVQSVYSMFGNSNVDYRFTSFRKSMPIADGGWVKSVNELKQPERENDFAQYKIAGGILKSYREYECIDDSLYLMLMKKGEDLVDNNLNNSITKFSERMLSTLDFCRAAILRRRNAHYLSNGLQQLNIRQVISLEEQDVPLFIPIFLSDRDKVRAFLFEKNVFCPIHWPVSANMQNVLKRGLEMKEHELSLIIDQRYGLNDMTLILELLDSAIHGK